MKMACYFQELLHSLRLVFYIFFQPSRWIEYAKDVYPADFTSEQLSEPTYFNFLDLIETRSWRTLFSLLITLTVLRFVFTFIVAGACLILMQVDVTRIAFGLGLGLAISVFGGLLGDMFVSVALAITGSIVGGVVAGIGFGLAGPESLSGVFANEPASVFWMGVTSVVCFGLVGRTVFSLESKNTDKTSVDWALVSSSVGVASILISSVFLLARWFGSDRVDALEFGFVVSASTCVMVGLTAGFRKTVHVKFAFLVAGVLAATLFPITYISTLLRQESIVEVTAYGAVTGMLAGVLVFGVYGAASKIAVYLGGPVSGALAGPISAGALNISFVSITAPRLLIWSVIGVGLSAVFVVASPWLRFAVLLPLYQFWNFLLWRLSVNNPSIAPRLVKLNSALVDEFQLLPLYGTRQHIVMAVKSNSDLLCVLARKRTNALSKIWPDIQMDLACDEVSECQDISDIREVAASRYSGNQADPRFHGLAFFREIAAHTVRAEQQRTNYGTRILLRDLCTRLINFSPTNSNASFDIKVSAANDWRQIIEQRIDHLLRESRDRREVDNPYIVGVPLTDTSDLFVGRGDVAKIIESSIVSPISSPVLILGHRRMGKTSLLNNLTRLLPYSIVPMFVDLQGPTSLATDNGTFVYQLMKSLKDSALDQRQIALPEISAEECRGSPFSALDAWLDAVELEFSRHELTGVITMDEFESLIDAFNRGPLVQAEILGMMRHIVQHRNSFRLIFASSMRISELPSVSKYLVNMKTVRLGYLENDDAVRLITSPVRDFNLKYDTSALEEILRFTHCHPALIQLLCSAIVELKNKSSERKEVVSRVDVDAAKTEALVNGTWFYFTDIAYNQITEDQLAYLISRARSDRMWFEETQHSPALSELGILDSRENRYAFQIPMVRHWFKHHASTRKKAS